ncbi:MAG: purine phosphorylase, partial [Acidobacteriota bacterium]
MNRVGVVAGLQREADSFRRGETASGHAAPRVDVLVCGIGPDRAARAARRLFERGAGALISWGFAGGLSPELLPGDAVIPSAVMDPQGRRFEADPTWRGHLLARLGMPTEDGPGMTLATTSMPLTSAAAKRSYHLHSGAEAVDMESAAVAAVAAEAGLPFLAIRAICDSVTEDLPPAALASIG